MNTLTIPVCQLAKSPLNVRRTVNADGIEELKASILAHGLMQNLVVTPDYDQPMENGEDRYLVIAGSRRLTALKALIAEGKLPEDYAVPCQVVTEDQALEMSIAENKVRHAMHPADEFEAFAQLVEQGQSPEQIAQRFGVTEKHVTQRLKLGRVSPELIAAYRAEELTLDALMAFTVTDDHEKQMSVYKSLQKWQKDDDRHIRRCLTETAVEGRDKLAKFVGADAYVEAGGTIRRDLFSEEVYFEQPALLDRLATEKLEATAAALRAEGWGWVETSMEPDYSFSRGMDDIEPKPLNAPAELIAEKDRLVKEAKEIEDAMDATEDEEELDALYERSNANEEAQDELNEQLETYAAFDPEEMKTAGCYVAITYSGDLRVEKGLVRKADQKATTADGNQPAPAKKKGGMPDGLRRDLEGYRLQVAQAELAMHHRLAFDLLVFSVAVDVLDHVGPDDGPDVSFRQKYPLLSHPTGKETLAAKRLGAIEEKLPQKWLEPVSEAERFAEFRKLTEDRKLALLAYCVASTLKPKLGPLQPDEIAKESAYDVTLSLTGASVAAYWRPTKDSYLGRMTRDQLLEIGKEVFGWQWADSWRNSKKAELVDKLDAAFANPDQHPADVAERLKTWLPAGMAFPPAPVVEEPVAEPKKPAKKSKKAA